jgi:hypothetical protein
MSSFVKRYAKKLLTKTINYGDPHAAPKPKLMIDGDKAYYQNDDGTKTPYKKNIVDKLVDRAFSR